MKKLVFRKWVIQVLCLIGFGAVMVMATDCGNIKTFVISHLIAAGVCISCYLLLKKYSNLFN